MGKIKVKKARNDPLLMQLDLEQEKAVRQVPRRKETRTGALTEENADEFIDAKLSKRILEQARLQQAELEEETTTSRPIKKKKPAAQIKFAPEVDDSGTDEEDIGSADYEEIAVDPEEEKQMELFMSNNPLHRRTLADIIQEKLTEKRTEVEQHMSDTGHVKDLDDRVVNMYKNVGIVLSRYRSGKVPKALKVVPMLTNWEQILYLMQPDCWSAAGMYAATRIFASSLSVKMAQRFYNLILLPRVRDDIAEFRKLNFHLYMAVRKALYKPAAFFKGFLLPLCESGTCTLQEAVILCGILHKSSIPMLHSAAAILKLAEMKYNGACSVFLRTLLDKKYALPYRVVDAVVYHFIGFMKDSRSLPVLWHQCLLVFVQRYKEDISSEQKETLLDLLKKHCHDKITPEIRREITFSKSRDIELLEPSTSAYME